MCGGEIQLLHRSIVSIIMHIIGTASTVITALYYDFTLFLHRDGAHPKVSSDHLPQPFVRACDATAEAH